MLNKILLVGRLTSDPVVRALPSGKKVAGFTLAVDNPGKDRNGNGFPTDFIDCVSFNDNLTRLLELYVKKGRMIFVEGRLRIRSYTDRNGIKRKAAEVVVSDLRFMDFKKDAQETDELQRDSFDTEDILDEVESKLQEEVGNDDFDSVDIPF
ncbi:single-stranded DNA-binding protein [Coprothermobacteraceae bacterium]|nr:single-stranded DNA-binding protein [Coprothermobacteraceae bacterium]